MVREPEIDRLRDPDEKADGRAKQLDCLEVLLRDGKHELFEFFEWIVRHFLAYESADVKLSDRNRQPFACRFSNTFDKRCARALHRILRHVIAQLSDWRYQQAFDLRTQDRIDSSRRVFA